MIAAVGGNLGSGAGWFAFSTALSRLALRGQADLSLASDQLVGQLQGFRQVAVLMADHPDLVALTKGQGDVGKIDDLLLATADKTGSYHIMLASGQGQVLASSRPKETVILTAGRITSVPCAAHLAHRITARQIPTSAFFPSRPRS